MDIVSAGRESRSKQHLGSAIPVYVGALEQVDAKIEREIQQSNRQSIVDPSGIDPPDLPSTEAQLGYLCR